MRNISKVAIFGAGRMGVTIAIALARGGIKVIIRSHKDKDKVFKSVKPRLETAIKKNKLSIQDKEKIIKNIYSTTDMESAANVDLIIETIIENLGEKRKLFKQLDKICGNEVIFATNTSSLSIMEISSVTNRRNRFVGLHFFNPADLMHLVEIIKTKYVSKEVIEKMVKFVKSIDKEPIVMEDAPGFIVNRLLICMINEAINLVKEGVFSPQDIDKAMRLGANHPVGPLALADTIGLDICLMITKSLYEKTNNKKYAPSLLLLEKVKKGQLGKKTKQGFYKY